MQPKDMNQQPYVRLEKLCIGYRTGRHRQRIVASGIDATLPAGQLTCLIGRNGTGKSTLLRTVASLQPRLGGRIYIDGTDSATLSQKEMARRVSIVLTAPPSTINMDVAQLVSLGRAPYTGMWGTLKGNDLRAVQRALKLTGINDIARRTVTTLSDGQRQKVMVAKALAQEAPLMLLDEPTAFLDYPSKARLMQLLARLAHEEGKTILLSTHDMEMAIRTADRLWLMDEHSLTEGTTEQMTADGTIDRFTDGLMPQYVTAQPGRPESRDNDDDKNKTL